MRPLPEGILRQTCFALSLSAALASFSTAAAVPVPSVEVTYATEPGVLRKYKIEMAFKGAEEVLILNLQRRERWVRYQSSNPRFRNLDEDPLQPLPSGACLPPASVDPSQYFTWVHENWEHLRGCEEIYRAQGPKLWEAWQAAQFVVTQRDRYRLNVRTLKLEKLSDPNGLSLTAEYTLQAIDGQPVGTGRIILDVNLIKDDYDGAMAEYLQKLAAYIDGEVLSKLNLPVRQITFRIARFQDVRYEEGNISVRVEGTTFYVTAPSAETIVVAPEAVRVEAKGNIFLDEVSAGLLRVNAKAYGLLDDPEEATKDLEYLTQVATAVPPSIRYTTGL
jgi:hypothetical protein